MKYSYATERIKNYEGVITQFEVADERDHRVATCYVEENAKLVVDRMNKGEMAPLLALALERLWQEYGLGDTDNRKAALAEAGRVLTEWKQLTKTPPGTE